MIPTLSKGPLANGRDAEDGGLKNEDPNKIEEISPENMKYAEPLIPVFGEEIV